MAEYYTQWSTNLDIKSEEEYAWLQEVLNLDPGGFTTSEEEEEDEESDPHQVIADVKKSLGFELSEDDFDWDFPGFEYKLSKDNLWAYAEEDGNMDSLCRIVQAFFRKFRPDGFFYVTWANTCSKMRVNEFNGGAMVVTAKNIKIFNVTDFVREQEKLHNKNNS
jgi:hypothetical protein